MLAIGFPQNNFAATGESVRLGLIALERATTAGELRAALAKMGALPGMHFTPWLHGEGLRVVADEQRELSRLSGLDRETGLATLRRLNCAILTSQRDPSACAPGIALLRLQFPKTVPLRVIVRAAHLCLATFRPQDVVARLGERTLGALLVGISPQAAAGVTERLRSALDASEVCGQQTGLVLRLAARDVCGDSSRLSSPALARMSDETFRPKQSSAPRVGLRSTAPRYANATAANTAAAE